MNNYDEINDESIIYHSQLHHISDQLFKQKYQHDAMERATQLNHNNQSSQSISFNDDYNSIINSIIFMEENIRTSYDFTYINIIDSLKSTPLTIDQIHIQLLQNQSSQSISTEQLMKNNIRNKLFTSIDKLTPKSFANELCCMYSETNDKYKFEMDSLMDLEITPVIEIDNHRYRLVMELANEIIIFINNHIASISSLSELFTQTNTVYQYDTSILKRLHDINLTYQTPNGLWIFDDHNVIELIKILIFMPYNNMQFELIESKICSQPNVIEQPQPIDFELTCKFDPSIIRSIDDLRSNFTPIHSIFRSTSIKFVSTDSSMNDLKDFCEYYYHNHQYIGSIFDYTSYNFNHLNNLITTIRLLTNMTIYNAQHYINSIVLMNIAINHEQIAKLIPNELPTYIPNDNNEHILSYPNGNTYQNNLNQQIHQLNRIDHYVINSPNQYPRSTVILSFMFCLCIIITLIVVIHTIYSYHYNCRNQLVNHKSINSRMNNIKNIERFNTYYSLH